MKKINLFLVAVFIAVLAHGQTVSNFANLTLAPDTFWDGSDMLGGFSSGDAFFQNVYDTAYGGYWSGFAYSDITDSTTPGDTNMYSAITASGYNGQSIYAVGYDAGHTVINLTQNAVGGLVNGFYVTNSTYAYLSMLEGDEFEHAFRDSDWFELNITGWHNGIPKSDTVHFFLADFRSPDSSQHYILNTWQWVDLRPLGDLDSLIFSLASSEHNVYGILTPAYFCLDNFTTADQPDHGFIVVDGYITINYEQDTLINVIADYVTDTAGEFLKVTILSTPDTIDEDASVLVIDTNMIWYVPTISVVTLDTVTYSVCDVDNFCDTAQIFFNLIDVGISKVSSIQYSVYPNPFSNSFNIEHSTEIKTINLYDPLGRLVESTVCSPGETRTEINAPSLASGAYFLKLISDDGSAVTKLIKQ